jgi:hypothetical protein
MSGYLCSNYTAQRPDNTYTEHDTATMNVWISRSSRREGFKKLNILTVPCLYIYALMIFVVKNPSIYQTNNSVHNLNTRQQDKLRAPYVRFSSIQKTVHYSSVKIFNQLPQSISKFHSNVHIFKTKLNLLVTNAFYPIEKFISTNHV